MLRKIDFLNLLVTVSDSYGYMFPVSFMLTQGRRAGIPGMYCAVEGQGFHSGCAAVVGVQKPELEVSGERQ